MLKQTRKRRDRLPTTAASIHRPAATDAEQLTAAIVSSPAPQLTEHFADHAHGSSARMRWALLLKRVFDIDISTGHTAAAA